jgi:hypothetical protein
VILALTVFRLLGGMLARHFAVCNWCMFVQCVVHLHQRVGWCTGEETGGWGLGFFSLPGRAAIWTAGMRGKRLAGGVREGEEEGGGAVPASGAAGTAAWMPPLDSQRSKMRYDE